jgi:hypothetical protein
VVGAGTINKPSVAFNLKYLPHWISAAKCYFLEIYSDEPAQILKECISFASHLYWFGRGGSRGGLPLPGDSARTSHRSTRRNGSGTPSVPSGWAWRAGISLASPVRPLLERMDGCRSLRACVSALLFFGCDGSEKRSGGGTILLPSLRTYPSS